MAPTTTYPRIKWLQTQDFEHYVRLGDSLTTDELKEYLKSKEHVPLAAWIEDESWPQTPRYERLVGYALMAHHPGFIELTRLYVDPHYRNRGYGEVLLYHVVRRMKKEHPNVFTRVSEYDVETQLFLSRRGFQAMSCDRQRQELLFRLDAGWVIESDRYMRLAQVYQTSQPQ